MREDHLKYGYFCIYNPETKSVEVSRSRTLPFGATHSVYSFLRLAKMLRSVACRGPELITTNFYDDFVLASHPLLQESTKNCMELVFLFTGWDFAKDGRKATEFSRICSALGVSFNLGESKHGILEVENTSRRIEDLTADVTRHRVLNRHDRLKLRGRLGFADGFLHGRLGALVLQRLSDHAYSFSNNVDDELAEILGLMVQWLRNAGPKRVDSASVREVCLFTDASYSKEERVGGLGGVLVDFTWFSLRLGPDEKETIIYELEPLASCLSMDLWTDLLTSAYAVFYGDNDSVRFALIILAQDMLPIPYCNNTWKRKCATARTFGLPGCQPRQT